MIITNELNLPESFVNMAKQDYIFADNEYRVTSLLVSIHAPLAGCDSGRLKRPYFKAFKCDLCEPCFENQKML